MTITYYIKVPKVESCIDEKWLNRINGERLLFFYTHLVGYLVKYIINREGQFESLYKF